MSINTILVHKKAIKEKRVLKSQKQKILKSCTKHLFKSKMSTTQTKKEKQLYIMYIIFVVVQITHMETRNTTEWNI